MLTHLRHVLGQAIGDLQVRLGLRRETGADLERRVDVFLYRARQAALRGGPGGTVQAVGAGLQFKRGESPPADGRPVAEPGTPLPVGHSFAGARERAALDKMLAGFGGPGGPLMQQVQRIAADTRRHGPEVAEGILQSLVAAQQNPALRTARARDVVLRPLQNSQRLTKCVLGVAAAVKSGLSPVQIADVLANHPHILSPAYTAENLLLDTENLGPIPGLSDLWRMLQTGNAQAKGFRYELEGAAAINRGAMGKKIIVTELSKRISVTLDGSETKTDIDVVVRKGRDTVIYNQLKRSAKALGYGARGLEATKLWVSKALAGLAKHKSQKVVYVVPPGVNIPPQIKVWLKSVQIDIVRINHAE